MSQSPATGPVDQPAPKALAAWQFFQQMLADITKVVTEDAENERELLEGLRVVARVSSLCAQMSVEADPDRPSFFEMCSENRMIGGPNPDGNYYLAMIRGDRRYRITRSEEHTSELQSHRDLVCRLLLEKKKQKTRRSSGRDAQVSSPATIKRSRQR